MTDQLTLVTVIIALVKVIKDYVPQVNGLVTVVLAALLGIAAGYFGLFGVGSVEVGLLAGLSAVGVHIVADKIGGGK